MGERGGGLGLPRGARDLLPQAARRRRELVAALLGELERWGYAQVETPLVEYDAIHGRGLGEHERARSVRFIEPGSGEVVVLRSDVTPQIARVLGRRAGGELAEHGPVRLAYAASIVQQPRDPGEQLETHQVGVELVGEPPPWGDGELVALCAALLRRVGLVGARIDLAHGQFARQLLRRLGTTSAVRIAARDALARKDSAAVVATLVGGGVPAEDAARAASLCERFGGPEVLVAAATELGGMAPVEPLAHLEQTIAVVAAIDQDAAAAILVDLGEVRGFDYYTGVRLRVWGEGVPRPIVRGGRYDDLLGRYGSPRAATGFAIDLDALELALDHAGSPARESYSVGGLAVACLATAGAELRHEAAILAAAARGRGLRAFVLVADDRDAAMERARRADADRLTWRSAGASEHFSFHHGRWHAEARGWGRDEDATS